jgi:LPXTG-site transpeptidase (sortase) family protein
MIIRDRTVRAFSLLVFVAGSAAIVVAAGAEWSGTPTHPTAASVTSHAAQPVVTDHPNAGGNAPRRVPRHPNTALARASDDRAVVLPRSLPATMLPAGTRLPNPTPPPSDPWAARQPTQLGSIVIPAIGLDQPFFEGVDQAAFAHGVGHWPGTAAPGGWGNAVFGGHRVTQTHPFLNTDLLRPGDEIRFVMLNGWTYVYSVTRVFVVPQNALWITDQTPSRTVTLFTCNPKGSATQRLVTNGNLLRVVAPT